jgi:U3 small nucleolar RNA-associated protein 13
MSLRPAPQGASRAWEVAKAHRGLYSGGKVAMFLAAGTPVLACLYSEDVAFVEVSTGGVLAMLQGVACSDDAAVASISEALPREAIATFCVNLRSAQVMTAARSTGLLRLWDVDVAATPPTAVCVRAFKGHAEPVVCMAYDPTGTFCATGSTDRTAKVFDTRGGFATHNFRGHGGSVSLVEFHPDAKRLLLVSASDDGAIRIWSLHDKSCVATLANHMSAVTSVAFSLDGYTLVTGSRDKVCNFWELRRNTLMHSLLVYEEVEGLAIVDDYAFAPGAPTTGERKRKRSEDASGRLVVVGSKGQARMWAFEAKDHKLLAEQSKRGGRDNLLACTLVATQPSRAGASIAYTGLVSQGSTLVAVTAHHNLAFLDPSTLAATRQIVGYNDELVQVKYIPGPSDILAVATNSPQLKLLRVADFSCELLDGHTATILALDVSPDGKSIATGSKDRTCRLWEVASGTCTMLCVGHTEGVSSVALSRKVGTFDAGHAAVFSVSSDCSLKRWAVARDAGAALAQPKATHTTRAHEKDINHVCVAPSDSLVATSSQVPTYFPACALL